jgi:hypothetical protein
MEFLSWNFHAKVAFDVARQLKRNASVAISKLGERCKVDTEDYELLEEE